MTKTIPKAKAKIKREERQKDADLEQALVDAVPTREGKQGSSSPLGDVSSKDLISVIADAIEIIYESNHAKIDRMNAEDKATILARTIRFESHARVTDHSFTIRYCKDHR